MSKGIKYCLMIDLFDNDVAINNPNGPITFRVDTIGTLIIYGLDLNKPIQAYSNGNWKSVACYEEDFDNAEEST